MKRVLFEEKEMNRKLSFVVLVMFVVAATLSLSSSVGWSDLLAGH